MDHRQMRILELLTALVAGSTSDEIAYKSEWLGYLPFGVYDWVEHLGNSVENLPPDWSRLDFEALEASGCLEMLQSYQNPDDEFDVHITYRVVRDRA